jgi:hypothetical protein
MRSGPCIYSIKKNKLCYPKKMRRNLWYNWLVVKQFSFTWQPGKCSWCVNLLQRNTQIIKQIERRQRGTERSNKWLGRKINKNKERVPKCWLGEFARMFKLSRLIVGSMTCLSCMLKLHFLSLFFGQDTKLSPLIIYVG